MHTRRLSAMLLVPWIAALVMPASLSAIAIGGYDANVHNRFDSGSFIGSAYDWSGVGRTANGRWATLISPEYIISANHFKPSGTITFWETNAFAGAKVTRDIVGGSGVNIPGTDLWYARLDAPVTSAITWYPIADPEVIGPGGMGGYANRLIYTVGRTPAQNMEFRVGQNRLDVVDLPPTTGVSETGFEVVGFIEDALSDSNVVTTHEAMLQGGDSGGPSFIAEGGILKLVGIHWFISTDVAVTDFGPGEEYTYKTPETWNDGTLRRISFDSFVPNSIGDLQVALIPEPSSILLVSLLLGSSLVLRRWRRGTS